VGRVGALPAARLEQVEVTKPVQEEVQEQLFGLASDQTGAELTQDGRIEAGIGQFQSQGVLPVDARADGLDGLAVRQALDVLEDGGQGEACGGESGSAAAGEQGGELVVAVEGAERLDEAKTEGAAGKGGKGDPACLFGDGIVGLRVKAHGEFSWCMLLRSPHRPSASR
jgi:hypothetical protein